MSPQQAVINTLETNGAGEIASNEQQHVKGGPVSSGLKMEKSGQLVGAIT